MDRWIPIELAVLSNPELSMNAKGLYAMIISLGKEEVSINVVLLQTKENKLMVVNTLKELKEQGYVDVREFMNLRGQIVDYRISIL
ncbi:hypothetical protein [Bacillus sp. FDAARGOS_1420]|uniref:hypothetical protein n=1 Tax=unclassified Bacillus (in: firmicutes) TaxID=185979 RepID=UPI001C5B3A3B|nr:hypothetical protein [Bacillus sp. FDAARGOS_1420]MBW3496487.1 hypothetical protein [Bacillus sp. FDAARGOS_1420]